MVTKLNETLFQIKVWNEIKKIPKGQITTYKEIAIKIKHPNALIELLPQHANLIHFQLRLLVIE
ncbi:MAG: 6-O-methylguanine methyltransferase, binding domain [Pseudomonadota bacterium]